MYQDKDHLSKVLKVENMNEIRESVRNGPLRGVGRGILVLYEAIRSYNLGIYHGTDFERIGYFARASGTLCVILLSYFCPTTNATVYTFPVARGEHYVKNR